jgi:hypothetical protein
MWKNIVERGRPNLTIWHVCIACWIPEATYTHTHTHTHRIGNTLCFSTATRVARTRLIVTIRTQCVLSRLKIYGQLDISKGEICRAFIHRDATKTNSNYKHSHLLRPMSEKRTVLPRDRTFRVEDSTSQFRMSSAHFRNCVAVRSVNS